MKSPVSSVNDINKLESQVPTLEMEYSEWQMEPTGSVWSEHRPGERLGKADDFSFEPDHLLSRAGRFEDNFLAIW